MTSFFKSCRSGPGLALWAFLFLLAFSPCTAFAQALIVEDFEAYRLGALSDPWKTSVSTAGDNTSTATIAVTKTLAAWGSKSLEISGAGNDTYYEGSLLKQGTLLKFDLYLPAGLAVEEVAGRLSYAGVKLVFMMDRRGVYRIFSEDSPTVAISGFVPQKWYQIILRVDYDAALAQFESGGLTSEVFRFSRNETGGMGSDLTLLGGKGMHLDAITLEASHQDYRVDADGDGKQDYLDPDDDNDGLDDEKDSYPLDAHLLFLETWEQGLSPARWKSLGTSNVAVLQGEGRQGGGAFDSAGDSRSVGGVLSETSFNLAARPDLNFWMRGKSSKTYWQNVKVGWSSLSGAAGNILQPLVSFSARPENSSSLFQYCVGNECFTEPWRDEEHQNTWSFCKIRINRNGTVSFYRDGQTLWTSRQALDFNALPYQVIEISGQSYQAPQLIDDISVVLPDGGNSGPGQLSGWRRWEGLTGTVDKEIFLRGSSQAHDLAVAPEGKAPAAFYSRGQSWPEGQLEFDFKVLARAASYAPGFFYRGTYRGQPVALRVQLSDGEMQVSRWTGEQFVGLASLVYDFKPEVTYRCEVNLEEERVRVFQNGTLKVSSISLPTHLEAQRLADSDHLLLVWLPPQNEAFSHLRIYRSTDAKDKGSLIADNLTGLAFVDKSATRGTTFFYRLHTVDVSGNESRKAVPLTIFRVGTKASYLPFSTLPALEDASQIALKGDTAITLPLLKDSSLADDYLPEGLEALVLTPATNQWSKSEKIEPGRGYFIQGKTGSLVVAGKPLPAKPFDVSLERGWNLIGNPFLKPVDIAQLSVTLDGKRSSFLEAVKQGRIAEYLYGYVEGKWYVTSVLEAGTSLPPWRGVYLLVARDCELHIPSP